MLEIYGSSSQQDTHISVSPREKQNSKNISFIKISSAIQKWWIELPDVIRLIVKTLPDLSPPLHIVSLNLLYHTTLILLHRPFILSTTAFDNHAVARSYQSTYFFEIPKYEIFQIEDAWKLETPCCLFSSRQGNTNLEFSQYVLLQQPRSTIC